MPSLFARVDRKYRTPGNFDRLLLDCCRCGVNLCRRARVLSGGLFSSTRASFSGENGLGFLADLYAFGAATSYSFVFLGLIGLRLTDPLSPRKFKIPLNVPMRFRGEHVEFPLVAVFGFIGIFSILMFTLFTHPLGRIFGPSWLVLGMLFYLVYRRYRRLPVLRSQPRDWRNAQTEILRRAGELELMDEYVANVKASDTRRAGLGT